MPDRDPGAIQQAVMGLVTEIARGASLPREIGVEDNLFERGLLDSLGLVQLVTLIEERFGIRMTEDDLASPEFTHIQGLANIIRRCQGGAGGRSGG